MVESPLSGPRVQRPSVVALVAVAMSIFVGACGSSSSSSTSGSASSSPGTASSTSGTTSTPPSGLKIAIFSPYPRNDYSVTSASIAGATAALKTLAGAKLSIVDNVSDPQQQVATLRSTAANNDIVVVSGGTPNQAVDVVAPSYPKVKFILYNGTTPHFHPNVTSVISEIGAASMVSGAVMANESPAKKLGFVTGLELPATMKELAGVRAGAVRVIPSATVASAVTGSYTDVASAKQATQAQVANGANPILGDLGLNAGLFQGIKGTPTKIFTYSLYLGPGCSASPAIVGGVVWDLAKQTEVLLGKAAHGNLPAGTYIVGVKDPKLNGFVFCPGKGSASDHRIAASMTAKLSQGTLKPPSDVLMPLPAYASTTG